VLCPTCSAQEREVAPLIASYWERAEFPHQLVPSFAALDLAGGNIRGYGCPGLGIVANAMAVIEIARVDASMSTFLLVHSYLAMLTIELLVSGSAGGCQVPGTGVAGQAASIYSL